MEDDNKLEEEFERRGWTKDRLRDVANTTRQGQQLEIQPAAEPAPQPEPQAQRRDKHKTKQDQHTLRLLNEVHAPALATQICSSVLQHLTRQGTICDGV